MHWPLEELSAPSFIRTGSSGQMFQLNPAFIHIYENKRVWHWQELCEKEKLWMGMLEVIKVSSCWEEESPSPSIGITGEPAAISVSFKLWTTGWVDHFNTLRVHGPRRTIRKEKLLRELKRDTRQHSQLFQESDFHFTSDVFHCYLCFYWLKQCVHMCVCARVCVCTCVCVIRWHLEKYLRNNLKSECNFIWYMPVCFCCLSSDS